MKFTKVKNSRVAVGFEHEKNSGHRGMMYKEPAVNNECVLDVDAHIKERYKDAGKLYTVLNQNVVIFDGKDKIMVKKQKICKEAVKIFCENCSKFENNRNEFIKKIKFCGVAKIINDLNINEKVNFDEGLESLSRLIIEKTLRKSLNKKISWPMDGDKVETYNLADIAAKLLYYMVLNNRYYKNKKDDWKNGNGPVTDDELMAFFGYIDSDKKGKVKKAGSNITRAKMIAESIKRKDVKVQLTKKDETYRLMLSNAEHPKKRFVVDFIKRYANLERTAQVEELLHIKKLMVMFVYGEKEPEFYNKENPYKRLDETDERIFCEDAKNILEQIEQNSNNGKWKDNKKLHIQLGESFRKELFKRYKQMEDWLSEQYKVEKDGLIANKGYDLTNKNLMRAKEDLYWIIIFEENIESYFKRWNKRSLKNCRCSWIVNRLWNEWNSLICMKYIDLGKAVFNFAMPDLHDLSDGEIKLGTVLPEYQEGITSFDYEMVKAKENITRDIATSIVFAANTFSNAVIKREYREQPDKNIRNDVLVYDEEVFQNREAVQENAFKHIFQYFGGASTWHGLDFLFAQTSGVDTEKNTYVIEGKDPVTQEKFKKNFAFAIKQCIAALRNNSFHYTTDRKFVADDNILIEKQIADYLFKEEYSRLPKMFAEKYFSNNVPLFFDNEDIFKLANYLYCGESVREAQVPAFASVIKRKYIDEFLFTSDAEEKPFISMEQEEIKKIYTNEDIRNIFFSAMYFILKEIYYYGFLKSKDLMERFSKAFEQYYQNMMNNKRNKEYFAVDNFKKHLDELKNKNKNITFGEFCQQIMTDYNMQNQDLKDVMTINKENELKRKGEKEKYKHYVLILYKIMGNAFKKYLETFSNGKENVYAFLKRPKYILSDNKIISLKDFDDRSINEFINKMSQKVKIKIYQSLQNSVTKYNLYAWYMTAHFLAGKQLNLLIGDFKAFKQYIRKIKQRAENTGNAHKEMNKDIIEDIVEYCDKVIKILEFVLQFKGRITANKEDYFADEEEYAEYMLNFIDYSEFITNNKINGKVDYATALKEYCKQNMENTNSTDEIMGIYYDQKNLILNRNVVYSKLYGESHMLHHCLCGADYDYRVKGEDIQNYYDLRKDLNNVFKNGKCTSKDDQIKLKQFQNLKNKIELYDIKTYTDLVNDIIAQFVSWAYLRERDLLYFQLGYHYIKLFWKNETDTEKCKLKEQYNKLSFKDKNKNVINITEGALLHQIVAVYDYTLPIINGSREKTEHNKIALASGTSGTSLINFITNYCNEEAKTGKAETYNDGLDFFGKEINRDGFILDRKDIAHMKYYIFHEKSIMEMFADMYNGFLMYDTKLKKSVSFVSHNILARYFIIMKTEMHHASEENEKFGFDVTLYSDKFTYKYEETCEDEQKEGEEKQKKVNVDARSEEFLEIVKRILEYKECK